MIVKPEPKHFTKARHAVLDPASRDTHDKVVTLRMYDPVGKYAIDMMIGAVLPTLFAALKAHRVDKITGAKVVDTVVDTLIDQSYQSSLAHQELVEALRVTFETGRVKDQDA